MLLLACFCAIARSVGAATLHVDEFASGTQGWAGGASPTQIPTGGVGGGGFLQISTNGGNLATFNDTAAWVGNLAAIGAARVEADLMSPVASSSLAIRLTLFGPTSTNDRWVSTAAQNVLNDGVWRHYVFGLAASDLMSVLGGGTHAQLMASTLRVMFRHDVTGSANGTSVTGTLGIDNAALAGVPEPASLGLATFAFCAAALTRRGKQR